MLRRSHILTTAALLAVCAVPASAAPYEDLRSGGAAANSDVAPPPSSIAASAADEYQDLRSPDTVDAAEQRGLHEADRSPYALNRGYGSPDAADAARDLPPVTHSRAGHLHGLGAQVCRVARGAADGEPHHRRDHGGFPGRRGPRAVRRLRLGRRRHRRGRHAGAAEHRGRIGPDADRAQARPERWGGGSLSHPRDPVCPRGAAPGGAAPPVVRSVMDSAPLGSAA